MDPTQNQDNQDQPQGPLPGQQVPPPPPPPPPPAPTPQQPVGPIPPQPEESAPQPQLQSEQPNEDEIPDYLKGADAPPAPGQAMHPPGGYQARPGESVQRSAAGGAVVQRQDEFGNNTSRVLTPPNVPQPASPAPPPQPRPIDQTPYTPPTANNNPAPNYQAPQKRFGSSVNFIRALVALVILIAVGLVLMFTLGSNSNSDPVIDAQIETDLNRFSAGVGNFRLLTGSYPTLEAEDIGVLRESYLPQAFLSPQSGEPYVLTSDPPNAGEIQYVLGGQCAENGDIEPTDDTENYAVRMVLSNGDFICKSKAESGT